MCGIIIKSRGVGKMSKFFQFRKDDNPSTSNNQVNMANDQNNSRFLSPSNMNQNFDLSSDLQSAGLSGNSNQQMMGNQQMMNNQQANNNFNSLPQNNSNNYNNMAANEMETLDVLEEPAVETMVVATEVKKTPSALDNGSNPVPVNPVAPVEFVDEEAKNAHPKFFVTIGICLGMLITPASTLIKHTRKFYYTSKAFLMYIYVGIISVTLCIASRVVIGCFTRTYNNFSGSYQINFSLSNIFNINSYVTPLIMTVLISFGFVFIVTFVYYLLSFFTDRGVTIGTYLMISTLSTIPLTIGAIILFPVGNLFSFILGLTLFLISFIYSCILFNYGVLELLSFKNKNKCMIYHLLAISIIGLIIFILISLYMRFSNYDLAYLISLFS